MNAQKNPLKLSILDLATIYNGGSAAETLKESMELVQLADKLGYTRYWFAEHHNTKHQVSTSPDLLAAHATALTKKIRLGSGGMMLPNHSPLKIVENFSILEALYPGRIDLGMGRAPGTDGITALALRRSREAVIGNDSEELLQELLAYFTGTFPKDHPFANITAMADRSLRPKLFMLGSSDGGMKIASQLGLGFAFAGQINPDWAVPMLRAYREHFQPSEFRSEPYSILSIIVVCGKTDEEAAYFAKPAELQWVRWGTGQFQYPPPTLEEAQAHVYTLEEELVRQQNKGRFVIGSAETVKEQLINLQSESEIDEVMVLNMISDQEARHRSFRSLANIFQLP